MTMCKDLIFVCGGMDNGQNLLSEFMIFNPIVGQWTELRQVRKRQENSNKKRSLVKGLNRDKSPVVSNATSMIELQPLSP